MDANSWSRWLFGALLLLLVLASADAARNYKYLELDNGMRVLLVSDRRASRSAASLDVGIGSWSDPEKVPGLAHFLEHMLFLGTEKYPVEGQYRQFLTRHGGIENAYTIYENTNFYFSAMGSLDVFTEALDRFAQFFIAPTLNANAGQREMQAVDSEFRKRLNNDYLRFRQVLMTMANPMHPYHRFTTGTIDTLNITGIHKMLVEFHHKYYSANLMTLCVLGKESLRTLERLVRRSFRDVPNRDIKRPNFDNPPAFPVPSFTGIKVLMEPLGVVNTVYMYWPLPSLDHMHREDPISYIAWLLGHEGEGSILSVLKSRQWATSVLSGPGLDTTSHWLMQVSLTLTDTGLANLENVLSLIFQYIRLIEREGVQERIYQEQHRLTLLNYLYQPKARPDVFVKTVSRNMQVINNPKDFRKPPTRSVFDPKLIRSILSLLTPQRLLLFVASPHYKQGESSIPNPMNIAKPNLDKVEFYYKTKYRRDKIEPAVLSRLVSAPITGEFKIPSKNPFVPGRLAVLGRPRCTPVNNLIAFMSLILQRSLQKRRAGLCRRYRSYSCGCTFRYPERLVAGHGYDLWWKRELNYRTPKLYVNILLGNPRLAGTIEQAATTLLFRHVLLSYLNDKIYPAKLAGFSLSISTPVAGIRIMTLGYSDQTAYTRLLETVMEGLNGYEEHIRNASWFASSQLRTAESIAGFGPTAQVYKHVKSVYENRIMQRRFFDRAELAQAMRRLTEDQVRSHIKSVLQELYINVFVYGNANQPEATFFGREAVLNLARKSGLKRTLHRSSILHQQRLRIPPGSSIAFRVKGPNPSDVNSGVNVMYQIGPSCGSNGNCNEEGHCQLRNVVNFIMSRALAYFMKAACFEQLRTKEQLGYIVFCYPYESNGIGSVHFVIQSSKFEPQYLLERVEAFVQGYVSTLRAKVSNRVQWFHGVRLGAAVAMSNGHNMKFRNQVMWERLIDGNCKFDRRRSALNGLRFLRHRPQEMMDFFETFFLNKRTRRMLAVQLYGKGKQVSTDAASGQTLVTDDTVEAFKKNAQFYPPETD